MKQEKPGRVVAAVEGGEEERCLTLTEKLLYNQLYTTNCPLRNMFPYQLLHILPCFIHKLPSPHWAFLENTDTM